MVYLILMVLALYVVQLFTPATIRYSQVGLSRYMGSRDDLPELPVTGQRAERALNNLKEGLLLFLPLAILSIVLGQEAAAYNGAVLYLCARIIYVITYIFAVPYLRSIVWMAGLLGLVLMALPLMS